jgi:hypothetical protein
MQRRTVRSRDRSLHAATEQPGTKKGGIQSILEREEKSRTFGRIARLLNTVVSLELGNR